MTVRRIDPLASVTVRGTDPLASVTVRGTDRTLFVLIKIFSQASAEKKTKRFKGFKVHSFNGRFQVTSRQ